MANHRKATRSFRDEATHRRGSPAPTAVPTHVATTTATDPWTMFLFKLALIALAVLWAYSPVIHPVFPADWLWDDDQLLTANATVQSTTPAALFKLWFNPDGADYFPLSYTALWAQWPLFGMWPTGYHLVTVLLHLAGALLLWRLLVVMRIPGAWLAAMIFALHPVCVESVAWVSELKNTLSLPLFLLAAINFVRFDDLAGDDTMPLTGPGAPPSAVRHYALALGYFLLAMLAKTSVVMFPVVLLLYAWWKRGTITPRTMALAAPFFLVSLVLGLITIAYQWGRAIGQETILVGGIASRLATAGMSILWYMRLIFWPLNLLPIYPRWEVDPPQAWQFLAWPVIGAAGWWFWKNRSAAWPPHWGRHALFAFGFFLLMVAPVLGFVTISYMRITWAADHFIYLPMISVIALVAAGATLWYERLQQAERPVWLAGAAVLVGSLAFLTFRYAAVWVNEDELWTHTLAINESAWQAHNRLGARKFARGHIDDRSPKEGIRGLGAFHHFTRSTALRPDLGETHNNLGTALSAKGRLGEAVEQFTEAARVTPHVPAIRVNLANSLAASGRFPEAAEQYRDLLREEPNNPALLNNYGVALYKQGRREEAIAQFEQALKLAPGLKDAQESLAIARGEKPDPSLGTAPGPGGPRPQPGGQRPPPLDLQAPTSPTLGAPLLP
jgi:lipoprotein NlpI